MRPSAASRGPRIAPRASRITLATCLVLCLVGCGGGDTPGPDSDEGPEELPPLLELATDQPAEVQGVGPSGSLYMPEIMGPGVGLIDADGDGDLDLFQPDFGPDREPRPPRLWLQQEDGSWLEGAAAAGLTAADYGQGVLVLDFDADGRPDLFQTNVGPNRLWRNLGGGRFEDVTESAGVGGGDVWSASATATDLDRDGDLDLFVTSYVALDPAVVCDGSGGRPDYCGPRTFEGVPDQLFLNRGDGTFEDISDRLDRGGQRPLRALGVVAADLTGDGRIDFYVANDNDPNQLWVQGADGRFVDEALLRGVALNMDGREEASMGVVLADLDRDADLDLFLTHLNGETNTFYAQGRGGVFEERTQRAGLGTPSLEFTGFGAVPIDLDRDGALDLATVNGHVFRGTFLAEAALGDFWNRYAQPGQLLLGDGKGSFSDASARTGSFGREPLVGRGLAVGDIDRDGFDDLVVTGAAIAPRVHLGRGPARPHWLRVAPRLLPSGRPAIGAVVTVTAGGVERTRRVARGGSYLSSSEPVAAFVLDGPYEAIRVRWPDGEEVRYPAGPAGRVLVLERAAR